MYKNILPLLSCPCCKKDFKLEVGELIDDEVVEGAVVCELGHRYGIRKGVLDFGSEEQGSSNNWSEYYAEAGYDDLDKEIDGKKTESIIEIQNKFLADITERTSKLEQGFLLDVASGRGMLLRELIKTTNENVHVISADLSFEVLMYDRIKLKDVNPNVKVSYIACDATNLPFKSHSIDLVCTFVGYFNMLELMEKGVMEGARVIKENALFLNSCIYMNEENPGFKEMVKLLEENNLSLVAKNVVRANLLEMHKKYFKKVQDEISYEGIAESVEGDLVPISGEWYANAIIEAHV